MNQYIIVITTVASIDNAKNMAKALVENKLSACVNILPKCYSIYKWNDNIEENKEYILLIKTIAHKYNDLEKFIKSLHSYEIPEIVSINIDKGLPEYFSWIDGTVI